MIDYLIKMIDHFNKKNLLTNFKKFDNLLKNFLKKNLFLNPLAFLWLVWLTGPKHKFLGLLLFFFLKSQQQL